MAGAAPAPAVERTLNEAWIDRAVMCAERREQMIRFFAALPMSERLRWVKLCELHAAEIVVK